MMENSLLWKIFMLCDENLDEHPIFINFCQNWGWLGDFVERFFKIFTKNFSRLHYQGTLDTSTWKVKKGEIIISTPQKMADE